MADELDDRLLESDKDAERDIDGIGIAV